MPDPAIVRLQLFGAPSIRAIDGREAAAALAQPKRVALLAYLAAAAPFGFHRRDSLLALFWPEADKDHARTSLRKAIHFLRHELGPSVIASRGEEEIGLGEDRVWCDVREFQRRLVSGHVVEALTLYQGDLLPGYFIPDAPEFERWLDEERLRLRERAAEAGWTLADRLEQNREPEGAAHWARWACRLTPDDERVVRRLIAMLGRLGDRPGAIRGYEELAVRLKREYEMAPSAETEELLARIRTAPAASTAVTKTPDAPRTPPPPSPLKVGERPTVHPTTRQYIAVFPFHVHGDASAAYLREGLVDMLSTNLDHAGTLSSIDPHALLCLLHRTGEDRLDPERAGELAEQLGAQLYVSGSVVGVAGRLRISAALHHHGPGIGSARFVTVAGPAERLFDLVDDLTTKLLGELHHGPGARLTRLAAATTASLPALKAYLAGERAIRGARHEEAVDAFEQAVTHDPEFTLAWYRLAFFLAWPTLPQPTSPWEAVDRALRHKHRLSERDRMLLEALSASLYGQAAQAERLYREILAVHQEDVEAWLGLGQTLVFHNQQRGRLITESRTAFERVLALDPDNATANLFLSYVAELEGDTEQSDRRIAMAPLRSDFVHPRIVQAFRRKDQGKMEESMAYLGRAPDGLVYEAVRFVATLTSDFAGARRIAGLLAEADRPPAMHGISHILGAFLDLASGRVAAARRELAVAAPLHPAGALEYRGLVAGLPFLPVARDELEVLRRTLAGWNASAVPRHERPVPPLDLHHDSYPALRLYLLGVLAARAEDPAALELAAELDVLAGTPDVVELAHDLARGVRARLASVRGDAAGALEHLEGARMESRCTYLVLQSPFYSYTAERCLRAELLEELGRYREAVRWYQSLVQSSLYDLPYLAPSHLHRGRIHERLGDRERAVPHYRRVLALWGGCDPELRPACEEAAERLQRLGGRREPRAGEA